MDPSSLPSHAPTPRHPSSLSPNGPQNSYHATHDDCGSTHQVGLSQAGSPSRRAGSGRCQGVDTVVAAPRPLVRPAARNVPGRVFGRSTAHRRDHGPEAPERAAVGRRAPGRRRPLTAPDLSNLSLKRTRPRPPAYRQRVRLYPGVGLTGYTTPSSTWSSCAGCGWSRLSCSLDQGGCDTTPMAATPSLGSQRVRRSSWQCAAAAPIAYELTAIPGVGAINRIDSWIVLTGGPTNPAELDGFQVQACRARWQPILNERLTRSAAGCWRALTAGRSIDAPSPPHLDRPPTKYYK